MATFKKLLSSTEIADSRFRSLAEVEQYLDFVKAKIDDEDRLLRHLEIRFSRKTETAAPITFTVQRDGGPNPGRSSGVKSPEIDSMKLDKVVVPDLNDLRQNFAIAHEIQEQIDNLDVLESNLSVNFRDVRGVNDTISSVKKMRAGLQTKLDRALKFLNNIGTKYAPEPFKEVVQDICSQLNDELTYSDFNVFGYATQAKPQPGKETGPLVFTTYVQLKNLEEDDGHQYAEFYIVFTNHLLPDPTSKGHMVSRFFVTVMPSFAVPGRFSPGRRFKTAKEGLSEIGHLLSLENISNAIGTVPHNISKEKFDKNNFRSSDLVSDIEVDHDSITFVFKKNVNVDQVKSAGNQLFVDVKNMFKSQIGSAQLKFRLLRDVSGRQYKLRFTLATPAKPHQVDIHNLDWLKSEFKLSDDKLRRVVNILNSD